MSRSTGSNLTTFANEGTNNISWNENEAKSRHYADAVSDHSEQEVISIHILGHYNCTIWCLVVPLVHFSSTHGLEYELRVVRQR